MIEHPGLRERPNISPRTLGAMALLLLLISVFVTQGHSASRTIQLCLLAVPAVLLMLVPIQSRPLHGCRVAFITIWAAAFIHDGVIRAFLATAYQAFPDSSLIIGAAANTTPREGAEYLHSLGPTILAWLAASGFAVAAACYLATFGARGRYRMPRYLLWLLLVICVVTAAGYALKPWRRLHPAVFWSHWTNAVIETRGAWRHLHHVRAEAQMFADTLKPRLDTPGPATVLLVISDSVNRDNLGLYGYARETTPFLTSLKDQLGDAMLVVRNAWSVEASTLPALNKLLNLGGASGRSEQAAHIIAMAKAAGYKTFWISNHDDMAIEQQHAKLADVVEIVNRMPGRSGQSLDSELLDCVQEAVDEPDQRKFIVVHLLGAHPHYGLRYPSDRNPFTATSDVVDTDLAELGRSAWIQHLRKEYDAAIRFHDYVVAELFAMTQTLGAGKTGEYRAWMYLSDHGQEVGHTRDFAGHSPTTPAGYRIPVLIWRNRDWPAASQLAGKAFRSDWTSWTLADLLNLRWDGYRETQNILSAHYEWRSPALPIPVTTYME